MKKCMNCGNVANDASDFCNKCGNSMIMIETPDDPRGQFCPHCGGRLSGNVGFCGFCGNLLDVAENHNNHDIPQNVTGQNNQQVYGQADMSGVYVEPPVPFAETMVEAPKKKNGKTGLIIAIVLFIIIGAVTAWFVYQAVTDDSEPQKISDENKDVEEVESEEDMQTSTEVIEVEVDEPEQPRISTYDVYVSDMTWEDAYSAAIRAGGYLVSVNSEEEFEEVCTLAEQQGINVFWLGIKRDSERQSWNKAKWCDGEDFEYCYWFSNEPTYIDENGESEMYMMAFKVDGIWYFNDAVNDVSMYYSGKMGYIVEIEE